MDLEVNVQPTTTCTSDVVHFSSSFFDESFTSDETSVVDSHLKVISLLTSGLLCQAVKLSSIREEQQND